MKTQKNPDPPEGRGDGAGGDLPSDVEPTLPSGAGGGTSAPRRRSKAAPTGELISDRFEVIAPLGEGGMGRVSLVRDRQIEGREVALKEIHTRWSESDEFRRLFFQEIRAAQGFVSEHVVQVRDCGELPTGTLFVTMDHVDGESLRQLLERERTLAPRHALEIARQILLGLASGHGKGFVHRDMKPSNVMLQARTPKTDANPHGVRVKLLDFGLAAFGAELDRDLGAGTPRYMSPEQSAGDRLDARSDLFSVGVMLYEMIAGALIFDGSTAKEVQSALIEVDPAPLIRQLEGVDKPIKKILQRALQKDREKRFASASDFVAAIEGSSSFKEERAASGWALGLAGVSILGCVGLGGMLLNERIEAGKEREEIARSARTEARTELEAEFETRAEQLQARIDAKESTIKDRNRIIEDRNVENARLDADIKQRDERILGLQAVIDGLREEKAAAEDKATTSAIGKTESEVAALKENQRQQFVIEALNAELKDVTALLAGIKDRYGPKLVETGRVFDRLAADISAGRMDPSYRRVKNAIESGTIDPGAPAVPYLERLEALGARAQALDTGGGAGSFAELAALLDEHRALSSEAALDDFARTAGAAEGGERWMGRWLGVELRTDDELLAHLLAAATPVSGSLEGQGSGADDEPALPEGTETELTPEEQEDVLQSVASLESVEEKTRFLDELKRLDTGKVHELLYRAHLSAERREARLEALRGALAAIGDTLQVHRQRLFGDADARAAEIAAMGGLEERCDGILGFVERYGATGRERAAAIAERFITDLEATVLPGGALTLEGLQGAPVRLAELADAALGAPGIELSDASRATLAWITHAQGWYLQLGEDTGAGWRAAFQEEELGRPTSTFGEPWRKRLAFEWQVQQHGEASGLAGADRPTAVFAELKRGAEDTVSGWSMFRAGQRGGAAGTLRARLGVDGSDQGSDAFVPSPAPRPGVVTWNALDLYRLRDLSAPLGPFEAWEPLAANAREAFAAIRGGRLGALRSGVLLRHAQKRAFGSRWSSGDPIECVIITDDRGNDVWVHPVLGVVRQQMPLLTFDLVHLEN